MSIHRSIQTLPLLLVPVLLAACGGPPGSAAHDTTPAAGATTTVPSVDVEHELGSRQSVPGTGISLRPPSGSQQPPVGTGFVDPQRRIQLAVELVEGSADLRQSFEHSLLDGVHVDGHDAVTVHGLHGTLGRGHRQAGSVDVAMRWLLVEHGQRKIAIIGAWPRHDDEYAPLIEASLKSTQWDPSASIDPEAAIGVHIGPVEGLELDKSGTGNLAMKPAGQTAPPQPGDPSLVVMPLPLMVPEARRASVCSQLLQRATPVHDLDTDHIAPVEGGTMAACDATGTAHTPAPNARDFATYSAIAMGDTGTFLVIGLAPSDASDAWITRFRAGVRSIRTTRGGAAAQADAQPAPAAGSTGPAAAGGLGTAGTGAGGGSGTDSAPQLGATGTGAGGTGTGLGPAAGGALTPPDPQN